MSKHVKELIIKMTFEPNRLSGRYLVDTYELLVPEVKRLIKKEEVFSKKHHVISKDKTIGENK